MDEILVCSLCPTPRSLVDFLREHTDCSRNGNTEVIHKGALVFSIETCAGYARVRQPTKGDVVEDIIPCEVAVRFPIDKEFRDVAVTGQVVVNHPSGKGDGRVSQPVQGLRV